MGLCGACTVHVNGQAVAQLPDDDEPPRARASRPSKASAPNGSHPVQIAGRQHNVPQCGYCQCGQIMQAAALLKTNPNPTDADIDHAMAGQHLPVRHLSAHPRAIKQAAGVKA